MYKLAFFVPPSHVDEVKSAVFAAGAGRIGAYDQCSWQVLGQGQFRPLNGSQPFLGHSGVVEQVDEWKVELVVADELIAQAVVALKQSHPYETPAYEVWRLEEF
ncbi:MULTISPECIES: YqfO family protein [Pseudomonas syringae group]|uniref:NGG1p interacting factor 3 protein, NIF3 n=1 Tax=Pseudomonas coronafaciens pv. porri TaxID=83964 RepID=A0ABR5JTY2_9PSED|nr:MULTISPECIES: YqfO family protein [Pseudomonas syringae group]KOP55567.1 NGG1p interacting factor 3 protein, NIF3 [Pseudomonas coronafaciens pv. porri]KOP60959.1 NGG1p interacting factor 3 protein, NIF3 [Pseudomonas coronafaciens pv. porri]MCF5805492.1 NGG1p interacting factor NIF3 [Pseudomonas tremae]MCF5810092.1 NGG1p interacting factor NIF3 [Pseudomonas tremae]